MYATLDAAIEPVGSVGFLDSMLQVELFLPCNLHFMYIYGTSIGCYRYIHLILHDLTCCNLLSCVVIYCD